MRTCERKSGKWELMGFSSYRGGMVFSLHTNHCRISWVEGSWDESKHESKMLNSFSSIFDGNVWEPYRWPRNVWNVQEWNGVRHKQSDRGSGAVLKKNWMSFRNLPRNFVQWKVLGSFWPLGDTDPPWNDRQWLRLELPTACLSPVYKPLRFCWLVLPKGRNTGAQHADGYFWVICLCIWQFCKTFVTQLFQFATFRVAHFG